MPMMCRVRFSTNASYVRLPPTPRIPAGINVDNPAPELDFVRCHRTPGPLAILSDFFMEELKEKHSAFRPLKGSGPIVLLFHAPQRRMR